MWTCVSQLTEGQVTFVPFENLQDRVYVGQENRMYEIYSGSQWKIQLERQFPHEREALNKFFYLLDEAYAWHLALFGMKLIPSWLVKFIFVSGLSKVIVRCFEFRNSTLKDVIESVTDNKDLREVLAFRQVVIKCTKKFIMYLIIIRIMNVMQVECVWSFTRRVTIHVCGNS